jgi:hypothetical protein
VARDVRDGARSSAMSAPLVYVHAGVGKTGTSAIQYAFTRMAPVMAEQGRVYPDLAGNFDVVLSGKPTSGNAAMAVHALKERRPQEALELVRPACNGSDSVVLSCEGFSNQREPELGAFVRGLQAFGYEARCLVFFRPQAETMVSSYLQKVKTDKMGSKALESFVEEQLANRLRRWDWHARARKLESSFGAGNVAVRWYPSLSRQGQSAIARAAFDWLGVRLPQDASYLYSAVINPTPSREALRILEAVNASGLGGKRFADRLLRVAAERGLAGSKVRLDAALAERVRLATHDSNLRLLQEYCPALSPTSELDAPAAQAQGELDARTLAGLAEVASAILSRDATPGSAQAERVRRSLEEAMMSAALP